MRSVTLAPDLCSAGLVFGCGGLGGATGHKASQRLLHAAWDAGFRHFDVAPSYGFGEAELFLGRALREFGGDALVTTKAGIARKLRSGMLRRSAVAVARVPLNLLPSLRRRLGNRMRSAQPRGRFAPADIIESVEGSLAALGRDRIDVLLLHECTALDLNDEMLRALEDLRRTGKVRMFGVGSRRDAILQLPRDLPQTLEILQTEWRPGEGLSGLPSRCHMNFHGALRKVAVLQKAFGSDRMLQDRLERMTHRPLRTTNEIAEMLLAVADADAARWNGQLVVQSSRPERISALVRFHALDNPQEVAKIIGGMGYGQED